MKKLYSIFCTLIITSHIFAMQELLLLPADIKRHILFIQINDVHNQVATPKEAREYIVPVSLINKECNEYVNNPQIIKNIIHNFSATLRTGGGGFIFYENEIAEKLNTPGSRNYIVKSN